MDFFGEAWDYWVLGGGATADVASFGALGDDPEGDDEEEEDEGGADADSDDDPHVEAEDYGAF